jgi:hypothetical protein
MNPQPDQAVLRASAFPGEFHQKRIALAADRRIIAINLPVVGEAACWTET